MLMPNLKCVALHCCHSSFISWIKWPLPLAAHLTTEFIWNNFESEFDCIPILLSTYSDCQSQINGNPFRSFTFHHHIVLRQTSMYAMCLSVCGWMIGSARKYCIGKQLFNGTCYISTNSLGIFRSVSLRGTTCSSGRCAPLLKIFSCLIRFFHVFVPLLSFIYLPFETFIHVVFHRLCLPLACVRARCLFNENEAL